MALGAEAGITAIVPTLGRSPHLGPCLRALELEVGRIVLVVPQDTADDLDAGAVPQSVEILGTATRLGFAAANNVAWRHLRDDDAPYLALVNDDAVVEPGWGRRLYDVLETRPRAAAVQGTNLSLHRPDLVDGRGLGWNRWWQAVQIDHGLPERGGRGSSQGADPASVFGVFGVSATAALYRRRALDGVAGSAGPFDEALFAYYEDVDLGCRLRAAGWRAYSEPGARALHAGSVTGRILPRAGRHLIHGNRYLVLARWLGRGLWRRLPRAVARDALDLGRLLRLGDVAGAAGVAGGLGRALRHLPAYAHWGPAKLEESDV
ncbi:MAG: glycosyltransferase family 2 protein [Acidobacteriota bacterium]